MSLPPYVQVDSLQAATRREKINSGLLGTRSTPNGKSHAEILQTELVRREAALVAAHADNERLRENISEQLRSKRTLRDELQVTVCGP